MSRADDKSAKGGKVRDKSLAKKSKEATEGLVVFTQESSKLSANKGSGNLISLEHGIVSEKPSVPHGVKRSAESDVIVNDGSLDSSGVVPNPSDFVFGKVPQGLDRGRVSSNDPSVQDMLKHMCSFFSQGTKDAQNGDGLPPASKKARVDLAAPDPDYYEYGAENEANGEYGYEEHGYEEQGYEHASPSGIDNLTIGELTQRLDDEPGGERLDLVLRLRSLLESDDPEKDSAEYLRYSDMIKCLKSLLVLEEIAPVKGSPKPRSAAREPLTKKDVSDILPLSDLVRQSILKKHAELVGKEVAALEGLVAFPCRNIKRNTLKAARFRSQFYRLEGDPICPTAGKVDHDFSTLWSESHKNPTYISMDFKTVSSLESSARKSLSTLSHLEWFATGISKIFDALGDVPMDEESTGLVTLGKRLTSSIGMVSESLVEEQSQTLSTAVLARREAVLLDAPVRSQLPGNIRSWLMGQPFLQGASLFGKVCDMGAPILESYEKRDTNRSMAGAFERMSKRSASGRTRPSSQSRGTRGTRGGSARARGAHEGASRGARGGRNPQWGQGAETEYFQSARAHQGGPRGGRNRGRGRGSRPNRGGRGGGRGETRYY
jgi:hypothetical protein